MTTSPRSSLISEESNERSPVSATIRLHRAMETHAALRTRTAQYLASDSHSSVSPRLAATSPLNTKENASVDVDLSIIKSAAIDGLAAQLSCLWQQERHQQSDTVDSQVTDDSSFASLRATIHKIGSCEKDELLLYLLEQQDTLRTQRSEVAALGERIAAQLVHQQHEHHQKHREQIKRLEDQLHEALHLNPQVAALQAKVESLRKSNDEHEQKLRFAVQKLQRSRKREKELMRLNDPLWD